jgi:hypothetical protein
LQRNRDVLQEDKDLGSMTMKQYMNMYKEGKKKKRKESLKSAADKQEKKKDKKVRILH